MIARECAACRAVFALFFTTFASSIHLTPPPFFPDITKYLNDGTDNMDVLAAVVDPLSYKENLTMSKLVVDATGDEFFQVRSTFSFFFPRSSYPLIIYPPSVILSPPSRCKTTISGGGSCPASRCA